jgi:hypothetical protein
VRGRNGDIAQRAISRYMLISIFIPMYRAAGKTSLGMHCTSPCRCHGMTAERG